MQMMICGIDIGQKGYIASFSVDNDNVKPLVHFPLWKGGQYCSDAVRTYVRGIKPILIVIEKPIYVPNCQIKTVMSLSECFGFWQGLLYDYTTLEVHPTSWKSFLGRKYQIGLGPKENCIKLIQRLFPEIELNNRNGKPNDNIAEAYLLALYGINNMEIKDV